MSTDEIDDPIRELLPCCPYCGQREGLFNKVYRRGIDKLHNHNKFYICVNEKCIFFISVKPGLIKTFNDSFEWLRVR